MNAYFEPSAAPLGYFGNQAQVNSSPGSQNDQYRGFNLLVPPYGSVSSSAAANSNGLPTASQASTPQNGVSSTRPESSERNSPPYETDKSSSYDFKTSSASAAAINSSLGGSLEQKNFMKDFRQDIAALAGWNQTGGNRLGGFDSNWNGGQAASPGGTSVAGVTGGATNPNTFYPWMAIAGE